MSWENFNIVDNHVSYDVDISKLSEPDSVCFIAFSLRSWYCDFGLDPGYFYGTIDRIFNTNEMIVLDSEDNSLYIGNTGYGDISIVVEVNNSESCSAVWKDVPFLLIVNDNGKIRFIDTLNKLKLFLNSRYTESEK